MYKNNEFRNIINSNKIMRNVLILFCKKTEPLQPCDNAQKDGNGSFFGALTAVSMRSKILKGLLKNGALSATTLREHVF